MPFVETKINELNDANKCLLVIKRTQGNLYNGLYSPEVIMFLSAVSSFIVEELNIAAEHPSTYAFSVSISELE